MRITALAGVLALGCLTLGALPDPAYLSEVLAEAAMEQTRQTRHYAPAYARIPYPNGDLLLDRGVCTDVIVRALRKTGIDLQKEVHEDMRRHFPKYPHRWGLKRPDTNIDHRRVPNLMTYFRRQGKALPISQEARDYRPGDIVAWDLGRGVLHIGMVSNETNSAGRYKIVHNIGLGANLEDVLFSWRIIGHYRYY